MPIKNPDMAHRSWNILRLALLWARKGGVFKRRLATELRLLPKYLKRLGHTTPPSQIHYFERELSFEKTPIFHVKMHRLSSSRFHLPRIPCINPQVDFDYDFYADGYEDDGVEYDNGRKSCVVAEGKYDGEKYCCDEGSEEIVSGQEGIDLRAEEFIAKFYQQMKLQRQISHLQHNETP